MRGDLLIEVCVDGHPGETQSTYAWSGGGTVLTISTVLPQRGLALELISTYVGHPHTTTVVTHLTLGPVEQQSQISVEEHPAGELSPVESARECAYDHAEQLIASMHAAGHEASVRLDDLSFAELERVE